MTVSDQWSSGPCHTWCLSCWPHLPPPDDDESGKGKALHPVTSAWVLGLWASSRDRYDDDEIVTVTDVCPRWHPASPHSSPSPHSVSASGAGPGLPRLPGPGRALTGGRGQSVRDQSQLCTECYIITGLIILSSQWSQWPHRSCVRQPGVRNVKRTLAASSWHLDPGSRGRSRLPVSRIPKLFH